MARKKRLAARGSRLGLAGSQNSLPQFESEPYEIVEKKGNSVVIQSPEKVQYQRNVTEVKKFTPREEQSVNSDHQLELLEDNELQQRPQRDRRPPDRYGEWE